MTGSTWRAARWRTIGVALMSIVLAACASQSEDVASSPQAVHDLFVPDLSHSALMDKAGLIDLTEQLIVDGIRQLPSPGTLTVDGFSALSTTSCQPLVFTLNAPNDTQAATARAGLIGQVPAAWAQYVQCLTTDAHGTDAVGSPIFGGIRAAIRRFGQDPRRVVVITDGCQRGDGLPAVCGGSLDLRSPDFAQTYFDAVPEGLIPDLSGGQLALIGIGQGKDFDELQIQGLQDLFTLYGQAAHATPPVQFPADLAGQGEGS